MNHTYIQPGRPYPLGATWDGSGVNFALFSAHAERIELCLFDRSGRLETHRIRLPRVTNQIWHGYLQDAKPGDLYGYRVYGPYSPSEGHRFNHHKLLLDPYAKLLKGTIRWSDVNLGYRAGSSRKDLSFDPRNNARSMPKCVIVDPTFIWGNDQPPRVPWSQTIIYETHVRGFTIRNPEVPENLRGTFAGLSQSAVIDYIKSLGVTAVELLPVQAFADDRFLVEKGLRNYWGYSTLSYFAPEPRYLIGGGRFDYEFKTMVRRFHDAGLEVILDVVYNHTAEGDHTGPTLCWRGIDNASYYRLEPEDKRYYINDTGCGNTFNLAHPRVLQMVMDSLRYWVTEMHVDGFRFDLATILGRDEKGFNKHAGFFMAIRQDPVLSRVKLIAEPWDIGPGGYQLGNIPTGWSEWNDRYRDSVRKFWRGDDGILPEFARRLHGSSDMFDHDGRGPGSSVNFVTSHDGYTLMDLVSYEHRHNEKNGEENRDGHHANYSANYGVEGPTNDGHINDLRELQRRNLIATLLLSQGTPMLLAGDEVGRTQHGNNNAYCQDNDISWLNWPDITAREKKFKEFVAKVIQFRRRHPVLQRSWFVHGHYRSQKTGLLDIQWVNADGTELQNQDWHDPSQRFLGMLLCDDVETVNQGYPESPETLLLMFYSGREPLTCRLPHVSGGSAWKCLLYTAEPEMKEGTIEKDLGGEFVLSPSSIAVWKLVS
ncbi:MAG: glycogen debranching protein GlgX [Gammaproteobacteria bacterium]